MTQLFVVQRVLQPLSEVEERGRRRFRLGVFGSLRHCAEGALGRRHQTGWPRDEKSTIARLLSRLSAGPQQVAGSHTVVMPPHTTKMATLFLLVTLGGNEQPMAAHGVTCNKGPPQFAFSCPATDTMHASSANLSTKVVW